MYEENEDNEGTEDTFTEVVEGIVDLLIPTGDPEEKNEGEMVEEGRDEDTFTEVVEGIREELIHNVDDMIDATYVIRVSIFYFKTFLFLIFSLEISCF